MLDLWPDELDIPDMKAPLRILRKQADLLGKKTRNIVEAEVVRDDERDQYGWEQTSFVYRFRIVAPLLGGYRYLLFSISHDVNFYPLEIILDEDLAKEISFQNNQNEKIQIASESEFIKILRMIFAARKTKQVITAIKLQSTDDGADTPKPDPDDIPF
jgi:hypothetical protein